jgi:hypothetical protein
VAAQRSPEIHSHRPTCARNPARRARAAPWICREAESQARDKVGPLDSGERPSTSVVEFSARVDRPRSRDPIRPASTQLSNGPSQSDGTTSNERRDEARGQAEAGTAGRPWPRRFPMWRHSGARLTRHVARCRRPGLYTDGWAFRGRRPAPNLRRSTMAPCSRRTAQQRRSDVKRATSVARLCLSALSAGATTPLVLRQVDKIDLYLQTDTDLHRSKSSGLPGSGLLLSALRPSPNAFVLEMRIAAAPLRSTTASTDGAPTQPTSDQFFPGRIAPLPDASHDRRDRCRVHRDA